MAKKNNKKTEVENIVAPETNTQTQDTNVHYDEAVGVSDVGGEQPAQNQQQTPTSIQLESSKSTLSPRPWKLGAVQIPMQNGDGSTRMAWVAAVVDQTGHALCCGDTVDMEFIIKLENSYDAILAAINASGKSLAEAVDVLQDFECKKSKAFKFN